MRKRMCRQQSIPPPSALIVVQRFVSVWCSCPKNKKYAKSVNTQDMRKIRFVKFVEAVVRKKILRLLRFLRLIKESDAESIKLRKY